MVATARPSPSTGMGPVGGMEGTVACRRELSPSAPVAPEAADERDGVRRRLHAPSETRPTGLYRAVRVNDDYTQPCSLYEL